MKNDMTTRQRIASELRRRPAARPTALVDMLGDYGIEVDITTVLDHVEHISQSVDADEQLLVAPPECRDCGFDGFDNLVNVPSKCPECRSEWIEEPEFTIR